jgi:glycosyltransferase involved in cell wall biosynthesis
MSTDISPSGGASAAHTDSENLVTICVTCYRRPTMAVECLVSCILQDYRPLDIDVSDDSPNADTEVAIRKLVVPDGINLRYRRNTPSLGEPNNVNSLFQAARGRHVVLLHDDDILLPGAITKMHQALISCPEAIGAFGIQEIINNGGEYKDDDTHSANAFYHRTAEDAGIIRDPLLSALRRQFPNNGYMLDTQAALATGYRDHVAIGRAGDTDFAIRLSQRFSDKSFVFIAESTSRYRISTGSSRTLTGISWKLYELLKNMQGLTAPQLLARDELMQHLVHHAMVDNALNSKSMRALRIMFSKPYRKAGLADKVFYHLLLIAVPQLYRIRSLMIKRSSKE